MNVLVIAVGVLSSICLIMSGLSTQRKRMLLFAIATSALCVVQYSLTESTLALIICAIGIIRGLTALAAMKHTFFQHWSILAVFLTVNTAAFAFTTKWDQFSIIETLPLVGAYLGTAAFFFTKMTVTKSFMIACGISWIIYEFHTGLYGQIVGETFTLAANIIALTALAKAQRQGIPENEVENVDTHVIDVITSGIPIIQEKVRTATITIPVINTNTSPVALPENN